MSTPNNEIQLTARSVEVYAEEVTASTPTPKTPRVEITAYNGGVMRVAGFGLVGIELSGVETAGPQVALLADHDSSLSGILGYGTSEVRDGKLIVTGQIVPTGEAATRVLELARNGFQFQASIGALPLEEKHLSAGEQGTLNGRKVTAPQSGLTLIVKSRLKEVSILSLGADERTSVRIAAQHGENSNMKTTAEADQIRSEERERIKRIEFLCHLEPGWGDQQRKVDDLKAQAMSGLLTESQLSATLLETLRASRPKMPCTIPRASTENVLEAALFCRLGLESLGEKHLGGAAMEGGKRWGGAHALDLCRAALELQGQGIPDSRSELVRAALSSIELPVALGNVAQKILLDAYEESPGTWRSFAAIRPVSDFKQNTGVRPTLVGQLEAVPPGGELKHGTMKEATFPFKIDTFGKMLSIDRRDLINDDLGVFLDTVRALGQAARRKLNDLIFQIILENANGFYSVGNGNLLTGVDSALSFDGLSHAITSMSSQRDSEGNDLDIKPAVLVVPPELTVTADTILKSALIQRNVNEGTTNVMRQIVTLETESRLSNTVKFGNKASKKAWHLFAAPSASPVVVAFLNGQETPTVEFFGLDTDPNRLAASWRVYHDFGAALGDPRASVRSAGQ